MPGSAYRSHKFERFRRALDPAATPGSAAFPIFTGERHFTLAEYQAESANASLPAFEAALQAEPAGRYLDLGCGMRDRVLENCLYLEVYPLLTADIIVDANEPYLSETDHLMASAATLFSNTAADHGRSFQRSAAC